MKRKKKKWKSLDIALLIMVAFFIPFVAATFYVFVKVGSEPTVLVGGVTASVLAEIFACMWIKINKGKDKRNGRNESEDSGRGSEV